MNLDRWAERIYTGRDFGRSIAISVSGIIGLVVYLLTDDWVIAVFGAVITFLIVGIASSAVHGAQTRKKLAV